MATQLCGALAAAHRAGVVHRDIKPSNVLCGGGTELDVRLCDFGLARTVEGAGLTLANAVLGTPEYMAPEVVTEGLADPRSDIYSLGIVLFEAATGRLPFYGDSPYQLMRQHIDVEAPRARSFVPELRPALDATIARALAKDPLYRFATAEDLARALTEEPRAVASSALLPAPTRRRICPTCGGWLVAQAAICADCGAQALRLEWQPGGIDVLVEGPGKVADKIDAATNVSLYRILDELAEEAAPKGEGRKAPRVPFYVARGVSEQSAGALVERLRALGLQAGAAPPSVVAAKKMREKAGNVIMRYVLLCGGLTAMQVLRPLQDTFGWPIFVALLVAPFALVVVAPFLWTHRPLVHGTTSSSQTSLHTELSRALRCSSAATIGVSSVVFWSGFRTSSISGVGTSPSRWPAARSSPPAASPRSTSDEPSIRPSTRALPEPSRSFGGRSRRASSSGTTSCAPQVAWRARTSSSRARRRCSRPRRRALSTSRSASSRSEEDVEEELRGWLQQLS